MVKLTVRSQEFNVLNPKAFERSDEYLEHLGANLWLMDNHKWALYVWEFSRRSSGPYDLIHVDYHWDAGYDFWERPEEEERLVAASIDELRTMIAKGELIKYDSFIGPALARGLIKQINFCCFQDDSDIGFYSPILEQFGCTQTIHKESKELRKLRAGHATLFDFCLDVFNRSNHWYESDLWCDAEIDELLMDCKRLVQDSGVVTVSSSFGYSGTKEDTRKLIERVVPQFMEWRNDS